MRRFEVVGYAVRAPLGKRNEVSMMRTGEAPEERRTECSILRLEILACCAPRDIICRSKVSEEQMGLLTKE
jgi:hypothetical protein